MKKEVLVLLLFILSFIIVGCRPEYVSASSIEEVYTMAYKDMMKAKTHAEAVLVLKKTQYKILKAQLWYQNNDPTNPRITLLKKMLIELNELGQ